MDKYTNSSSVHSRYETTDKSYRVFSCYRLLLFVDEADAFLRKRATVSLHVFNFPETLEVCVTDVP